MPTQWFDWGQSGRGLGQALIGANNAYQHGFEGEMSKLGKAALMAAQSRAADAVAMKHEEDVSASQQRRQFQTPEFGSKIAASLAGLTEPQRMETDAYLNSGTWTKPLPVDVSGPPEPTPQAPDWAKPETMQRYNLGRAAHLTNLGATGNTNAEQIVDAFAKLLGQGRIDNAMANPQTIHDFGAAMAASQGKPLYTQGANGVMQLFTGDERINDVGKTAAQENRAQAANAYASAEKNRAGAEQIRNEIANPATGKAPTGYRFAPDGNLEAIPGGPADIKAGELGEKAKIREQVLSQMANSVLDEISQAKNLTGGTTTGAGGLLRSIPMTEARKLDGHIQTIRANLGFDRLQLMREMSPTGGALGQVAVQELVALQSSVAMLDQLQKPADLRAALNKIEGHYNKWLDVIRKADAQKPGAGGTASGAAPGNSAPQKLQRGQVMDGFRFKGGDPSNPASWEPVR